MIISCTGHRPPKLGGYELPNPIYLKICQETEQSLLELKPEKCLSGMALGYDSYFASVVLKLGLPLVAVIPFKGQESQWPETSQKAYRMLIDKASEVIIVSEGGYSAQKMQIRNQYLVDNCDLLLACHDGSPGGTGNCVAYAESIGKPIRRIIP